MDEAFARREAREEEPEHGVLVAVTLGRRRHEVLSADVVNVAFERAPGKPPPYLHPG
jgi:hypothetical protein